MKLQDFFNIALAGLIGLSAAHPGEQHEEIDKHAAMQKRAFQEHVTRGLEKCARQLETNGVYKRAEARRRDTVDVLRRGLPERPRLTVRDPETVLNTSHLVTNSSINTSTPDDELFTNNSTCVLNPEGETGPFYVPGEYVRTDLRESESGVNITLEAQFIDVETCEPLTNVWWDIWNCNATGVYAGVVENGNGNVADTANINRTFLRGIQQADSDGVVRFDTLFPGHYSGRATHHHIVAHIGDDITVLANDTITGGSVAHIGQLFYDQDLITEVESTYPYNTNTITITENADDRVFLAETENTTSDPVINYVFLGDDVSDGLFGWVTIAVDTSASYDPKYSFVLTSSGGVEESGGTDTK
jgi:protocatechuate 3,4-dioxygenase beta subunit